MRKFKNIGWEIPHITRNKPKLYGHRNAMSQGQYFLNHMNAMTVEGLHSKADIAKELAHRDIIITKLESKIDSLEHLMRQE